MTVGHESPDSPWNGTMRKFGAPGTCIRQYPHWTVLLRPKQATLGALVLAAREPATALPQLSADALAEQMVDFERELAVIGVRGRDGDRALFPVTETIHREEILRTTTTPPRTGDDVVDRARSVALDVLDVVDGRGVVGIEMFETTEGEVLFNEAAPRPHNSGHWTIEGARTSQFEQHLRAVLGWPLGATRRRCPTASANLLGDVDEPRQARLHGVDRVLEEPGAHLHWYGKREARPLRKMGHLTVTGEEEGRVAPLERAEDLAAGTTFVGDETDEGDGEGGAGE